MSIDNDDAKIPFLNEALFVAETLHFIDTVAVSCDVLEKFGIRSAHSQTPNTMEYQ